MTWNPICPAARLPVDRGVCALVAGEQVALFLVDGVVHALGNRDPVSGSMVLSRGIVGSRGDEPTVASPMYKQVYSLLTGRCLDDAALAVPVHDVRVVDGLVEVRLSRLLAEAV
jgi:nitrite reductase (NADH) small subunit